MTGSLSNLAVKTAQGMSTTSSVILEEMEPASMDKILAVSLDPKCVRAFVKLEVRACTNMRVVAKWARFAGELPSSEEVTEGG